MVAGAQGTTVGISVRRVRGLPIAPVGGDDFIQVIWLVSKAFNKLSRSDLDTFFPVGLRLNLLGGL